MVSEGGALGPGLAGRPCDLDPALIQGRLRPGAIAVIDPEQGRRITYGELDERVARAAGLLQSLLAEPVGARVAVLARNSLTQVVLFLACQRAGAVFMPMNWRLAGAELAALAADAEPRLLIYDEEFADQAAEGAAAIALPIPVGSRNGSQGWEAMARESAPVGAARLSPDAPCVLLYTSGTTGRAKGVVITRRGAFYAGLNFASVGEVTPASTLLCDVPMFHTVGLFAVVRTALATGGRLVVSDRFLPARTLARLSDPELGVTHYFGVPQIAAALREHPDWAGSDLSRLKAFFTGGAPLAPALIDSFMADGVVIVNGYGMSEAGTVLHMPLDPDATRRWPGSVGYPAPTVEVQVVGRDGAPVAEGETGELWIRGPAVTPGYWNQPEATAAALAPGGWFRTGDAARLRPNGMFDLIDRWKDMYVSGGENVYPAEIEAVLLAHPDVADAAVVGAPDPRWGECGVAFVVAHGSAPLDPDKLIAHCGARLARFKLPRDVRVIDAIPRTASGKIRKDLLRQRLADASPSPVDA